MTRLAHKDTISDQSSDGVNGSPPTVFSFVKCLNLFFQLLHIQIHYP
jgi:hypothetical protein